MNPSCLLWWLLLPLVTLLAALLWATETRHTRIRSWRAQGHSWRACADRLGCSPSTARRWAMA
jgi:hypothetical protein